MTVNVWSTGTGSLTIRDLKPIFKGCISLKSNPHSTTLYHCNITIKYGACKNI